ncbi:hypothetical protein [Alteraurantiacibacter aestuarii]|uniref:TonB C-terminal domain-containing protein n=1 Tax=Alteraurantiacibacter aestuarii TaxID=650004 RepID=A0A844ZHN8_9SPHN|nr:hypothetical protein [Alteraurantiacibacter aestuarii]MXO87345.1 hypothetical protein [Alteraurantiacibacter aestuarii]
MFFSGAALAAEPKVLEPTSDWTLDYGEERCSLIRDFGQLNEEGLGLRIDSYGSLASFRISLIGDLVPRNRRPVSNIAYSQSPDTELRTDIGALNGTIGEFRSIQFSVAFLPAQVEKEQNVAVRPTDNEALGEAAAPNQIDLQFESLVDSFTVEMRRGRPIRLETGPIGPALEAMRHCVDDLRASWGLNPEQQRLISRRAFPNADAVRAVTESYPDSLAWRGTNGFIPLRVMVPASGLATQCVVQLPNAPEAFAEAACDRLGNNFNPALDENGEPIDSFYQTSVLYLVRN